MTTEEIVVHKKSNGLEEWWIPRCSQKTSIYKTMSNANLGMEGWFILEQYMAQDLGLDNVNDLNII